MPSQQIILSWPKYSQDETRTGHVKWEKYDLKPTEYFYPERDLVPAKLISAADYKDLRQTLEEDTQFLCSNNAVDYSLLLVRFPANSDPEVFGRRSRWKVGAPPTDERWKYRVAMLGFFWEKRTLHAQAMTRVVQMFDFVGQKKPMSITATAGEYRKRFLSMVDALVKIYQPQQ